MLEVTESVLIEPDAVTHRTLEALRESGVTVALDDFGTGYSSSSYLGRLPVDMIKLDRGFMAAVPDAPAQRRLVAGIARLGETLGVCMVAEGIERQAQLSGLVDLGVRLGQGLMLGGPVRADAFAERLAAVPRVLDRTVLKPA